MSKVLCKSCDLVVSLPPYKRGYQCVCPNCGALLRPARLESEFNVALVAISAFILALVCIFQPYMEISSMGVKSSLSLISIFTILDLSLIHISEPTRRNIQSRMPSSA